MMTNLEKLVEEIWMTLSQPVPTEKAKDNLIGKAKTQFLSLRTQLKAKQNHSDRAIKTQSVATQTEHLVSCTYKGMYVERPQEDSLGRWWVCACGKENCPTCQAEKAATTTSAALPGVSCLKNNSTDSSCQAHGKPHRNLSKVTFNVPEQAKATNDTRATDVKETESKIKPFVEGDSSVMVKVWHDFLTLGSEKHSWYILQIHPAISASGLPGMSGNPLACGIIGLVFAHHISTGSPQMMELSGPDSVSHLGSKVLEVIRKSIIQGLQQYALNCSNGKVELGATQIVLITSELGYRVKNEEHFDSMVEEMLIHYCTNLECGQTLLFIRHTDYKVITIFCCEGKGKKEVIFLDPQKHNVEHLETHEREVFGALLFYTLHEIPFVLRAVGNIHHYSGSLSGRCTIAVLDKEL